MKSIESKLMECQLDYRKAIILNKVGAQKARAETAVKAATEARVMAESLTSVRLVLVFSIGVSSSSVVGVTTAGTAAVLKDW